MNELLFVTGLTVLVAAAGGFLRTLYGGAPHVPDPVDATKQLKGWLYSVETYPFFFALSVLVLAHLTHPNTWGQALGIVIVSFLMAAIWNPGHGSYLNPGNGSADNELVFNKITPLLSFGARPGSVRYCCVGMGVRYGLATCLVGLGMYCTNQFLGTNFNLLYSVVGWFAGLGMYGLYLGKWWTWDTKNHWINHNYANVPFEIYVGALLNGGLVLTHTVL